MPVAVLMVFAALLALAPARAAQANITILGAGPANSAVGLIAAALPEALGERWAVTVKPPADGADPLLAVAEGRAAAALVHGDTYRAMAHRTKPAADLEFLPLRRACLVLLVHGGGDTASSLI